MEILKVTILGLFFGTFGTTIGGVIGILLKNISNKILSFILSFAAGLMMAVVCFELIPEALSLTQIIIVIATIILGIIVMLMCEFFVNKSSKIQNQNNLRGWERVY